jgi:hypothetical protein
VVVAEQPSSVRLLVELTDVRLLFHADRGALALVPRTSTVLSVAPNLPADAAAGVRVAPGLLLIEKERRDSMLRVQGASGKLSFEGWVAADALGVVFEREAFDAVSGDGLVREGTSVLTSAGGLMVATFGSFGGGKPEFVFRVEPESGAPPGWQRIRVRTRELEVRGLVAAADYKPNPPGHGRLSGGHQSRASHGSMSDTRRGMLAEGTSLYAPVDRACIGRVRKPMRVYYGFDPPDPGGFLIIEFFAEELGIIAVLAKSTDIEPESPH